MDGFCIILYPEDRSWIATPDFIRGLASLLGTNTLEYLWIFREVDAPPGEGLPWQESTEKLLELRGVPVEEAITRQRIKAGCSTHLDFGSSSALDAIGNDVLATLPEDLSEGATPLEASFSNGEWVHHRFNDGERMDGGACRLTLSNYLGYPVEMDDYLEAFLAVDAVKQFRQRLEHISSRPWTALIDLA